MHTHQVFLMKLENPYFRNHVRANVLRTWALDPSQSSLWTANLEKKDSVFERDHWRASAMAKRGHEGS
jgi:hypothetical protein